MIAKIRSAWPKTQIVLRGDADFGRDPIMSFCEENGIDFVFGLSRNPRLQKRIVRFLERSRRRCLVSGKPSRRFVGFTHQTLKGTWTRPRRVVGKAEYLPGHSGRDGAPRPPRPNARFVVTSLPTARVSGRDLYELEYVKRGDCENRIYEQLQLHADRASASRFMANQLRLYFSGLAYVLCAALRRLGIDDPEAAAGDGAATDRDRGPARATAPPRPLAGTIRERYLKVAVRVRQSTRRVLMEFSSAYPYQEEFAQLLDRLMRQAPVRARAPGI